MERLPTLPANCKESIKRKMERSTISRWNAPLIPSCQGILLPRSSITGHDAIPARQQAHFPPGAALQSKPPAPSSRREDAALHAVRFVLFRNGAGAAATLLPSSSDCHSPGILPMPLIIRCWPFKAQHSISFIPAPKPAEWGSCESHMTHSTFCNVAIKKEFPAAAIALQPCRQPAPPLVRFASVGNATLQ